MQVGDKIKLITNLPIHKNCGAFAGEIFEITGFQKRKKKERTGGNGLLTYFIGKDGSECGTYNREFELLDNNTEPV